MKIAICTPTHSDVKAWFAHDLAHLVGYYCCAPYKEGSSIRLVMTQSSILPSGRHDLVKSALNFDATHVLWLDSDMRFPQNTLHRLLQHDKDMVLANYVTRKMPIVPVCQDLERKRVDSRGKTGIEEIYHGGLGVCLMKAEILRKMEPPYFMFGYTPSGKFVGEDVYFIHKARGLGYQLWVDHDLSNEVSHIGDYEYDMQTLPDWEFESQARGHIADEFSHRGPGTGNGDGTVNGPVDADMGPGVGLPGDSIRPAV